MVLVVEGFFKIVKTARPAAVSASVAISHPCKAGRLGSPMNSFLGSSLRMMSPWLKASTFTPK